MEKSLHGLNYMKGSLVARENIFSMSARITLTYKGSKINLKKASDVPKKIKKLPHHSKYWILPIHLF